MATLREEMRHRLWRQKNPNYAKEWYQKNRERLLADANKYRRENRNDQKKRDHFRRFAALTALGGKCVHCGEDDLLVLQIDHIEDLHLLGKKRTKSEKGSALHLKIIRNRNPTKIAETYQVLCANCHLRKTQLAHIEKDHSRGDIIKNVAEFKLNPQKYESRIKYTKYNPAPKITENLPPAPRPPGKLTGRFPQGHGAGQILPGAGVRHRKNRWVASIEIFGTQISRTFNTEEEARECRRKMEYGDIPPAKPIGRQKGDKVLNGKVYPDPGW